MESQNNDHLLVDNVKQTVQPVNKSLKEILTIAIPTIIYFFSTIVIESINLIFVGHLGIPSLVSGVALGNMFFYTFGLTVIFGFNSVIETLASQTYGQNQLHLCGVYLNRGRMVAFFVCMISACCMFCAQPIFLALGIEEDTVEIAQKYILMLLPYLFLQTQVDLVAKFLNCFQKGYIIAVVQIITAFFHIWWCYLFAKHLELGLVGIAIAMNLNGILNLTITTLWVSYWEKDMNEAWFWPDRSCLAGLGDYMKMGWAACLMLSLEWWAFDIQIFISIFVSTQAMGVQCIVNNVLYLLMCVTYGLQYSGQILIGVSIGEKNIAQAYQYRKIVCILGVFFAVLLSLFLYVCKDSIAQGYTNIEVLYTMIADTFSVVAWVHFWICCQLWLKGIIIALGKFWEANVGLLVSCYLISVPLGCYFCFSLKWGIKGLWWGFFVGLGLLVVYYFYLVFFKFDWKKISIEAHHRSEAQVEQIAKFKDTEGDERTNQLAQRYQIDSTINEVDEDKADEDMQPLIHQKKINHIQ